MNMFLYLNMAIDFVLIMSLPGIAKHVYLRYYVMPTESILDKMMGLVYMVFICLPFVNVGIMGALMYYVLNHERIYERMGIKPKW
jgi:hypothetical protein